MISGPHRVRVIAPGTRVDSPPRGDINRPRERSPRRMRLPIGRPGLRAREGRAMRRRRATIVFSLGWLGVLAMALRLGATAHGINPEQLLSLLVSSYMGAWGLVFFLSRQGRVGDAARFLACTGSILLVVALVEVPAALGWVDYRSVFATPTPTWRRPGYRADPELIYVREGNRQARWNCVGSEIYSLR